MVSINDSHKIIQRFFLKAIKNIVLPHNDFKISVFRYVSIILLGSLFERLENKFKVINTDKIEEYQKIFPKTNIYKNNKSPIGQDFLEKLIL